jgi:hypothetical protein
MAKINTSGGRAKSQFEFVKKDFDPNSINDVLFKYKDSLTKDLIKSLEDVDRVSTGALSQSIRVDIDEEGGKMSFTMYMDDYWKFVDQGVNGTKNRQGSDFSFKKKNISEDATLDFIKHRGIGLGDLATHYTNSKNIRVRRKTVLAADKARKSLAWLIGRSISQKGIKPTHFFTDVVNDELKKELTKDISFALGRDILISFGLTNK